MVEDVELEFGPKLNVLTGETGAGKSLVLESLALLAGARASGDRVRTGADCAVIEAVFRTDGSPSLEAELEARGIDAPDHELVVRRTVAVEGRSRAQVGGQLVPVSTLAELFRGRIEISSQHESQALLRRETHGRLLDASGGLTALRETVASGFAELRTLDAEIETLRSAGEERARREDFLAFQMHEIDEAKLVSGESQKLEVERERLVHADRLRGETALAATTLSGDPQAGSETGAVDAIAAAMRQLEPLALLDGSLGEIIGRLRGLHADLLDAASELERFASEIESDPIRLAEVEARSDVLHRLSRKYGGDEDAILEFRANLEVEWDGLRGSESRLEEMCAKREKLRESWLTDVKSLSRGRAKAARKLERAVTAALGELALAGAELRVNLEPDTEADLPRGPFGAEIPEFLLAANAGEPERPLRRVASGGELSRVFLALKNCLREQTDGMVLVFDEVDAGVGGAVADRVGRVLGELAGTHQVLCITHLPQIAAGGVDHFKVEKVEQGGRTRASIAKLQTRERVDEIARMAGGAKVTAATRKHARELLGSQA